MPSTVFGVESDDSKYLSSNSLYSSSPSALQSQSVVVPHSSESLKSTNSDLQQPSSCGSANLSIDEILSVPKAPTRAEKKTRELALQTQLSTCQRAHFFSACMKKKLLERKNKSRRQI